MTYYRNLERISLLIARYMQSITPHFQGGYRISFDESLRGEELLVFQTPCGIGPVNAFRPLLFSAPITEKQRGGGDWWTDWSDLTGVRAGRSGTGAGKNLAFSRSTRGMFELRGAGRAISGKGRRMNDVGVSRRRTAEGLFNSGRHCWSRISPAIRGYSRPTRTTQSIKARRAYPIGLFFDDSPLHGDDPRRSVTCRGVCRYQFRPSTIPPAHQQPQARSAWAEISRSGTVWEEWKGFWDVLRAQERRT